MPILATVPLEVKTPFRTISTEIGIILLKVRNGGTTTAREASPHVMYRGMDALIPVCWMTTLSEGEPIRLESKEEVTADPDELSEWLRKNFFTKRSRDIQPMVEVHLVIAFAVKDGKFARIPTVMTNGRSFSVDYFDLSFGVSMEDYEPTGYMIANEVRYVRWDEVKLGVLEPKT